MNKDVLLTIYKILHRDLTKQLNAEYISKVSQSGDWSNCLCGCVCYCYITIQLDVPNPVKLAYNYRSTIWKWHSVNTKYGKKRCLINKNY